MKPLAERADELRNRLWRPLPGSSPDWDEYDMLANMLIDLGEEDRADIYLTLAQYKEPMPKDYPGIPISRQARYVTFYFRQIVLTCRTTEPSAHYDREQLLIDNPQWKERLRLAIRIEGP